MISSNKRVLLALVSIPVLLPVAVVVWWLTVGEGERPPQRAEFGALATSGQTNRAGEVQGHGLCIGVPGGASRYLCAARQSSGTTEWHFGDGGGDGQGERLLGGGDDGGESVADFEVDRSWHYLAVITAAEGHPFLAVYDLGQWQASGKRPDALLSVNPYPGVLQLDGWGNNMALPAAKKERQCVYFSSDGPVFSKTDNFPLPHPRPFRACFPGGHVDSL